MMIVSKQTRAGADKGNGVILTYKKKHLQEQPEGSKRWKQEAAKGSNLGKLLWLGSFLLVLASYLCKAALHLRFSKI